MLALDHVIIAIICALQIKGLFYKSNTLVHEPPNINVLLLPLNYLDSESLDNCYCVESHNKLNMKNV